jgi:hypothetical protein
VALRLDGILLVFDNAVSSIIYGGYRFLLGTWNTWNRRGGVYPTFADSDLIKKAGKMQIFYRLSEKFYRLSDLYARTRGQEASENPEFMRLGVYFFRLVGCLTSFYDIRRQFLPF